MQQFRKKHLISLLESYDEERAPIDFHVSSYFRHHPSLGSKDRAYIAETVYRLIRWKGLIDHFVGENSSWEEKAEWLHTHDPRNFEDDQRIAEHIRASFPLELYEAFKRSWGERTFAIALDCNETAPTTIRVNTLKTTREKLVEQFKNQGLLVSCGSDCPTAIIFHKKVNFFTLPEFKDGLFEVQDEASQLVAEMVAVKPQEKVLDFCSGSGGKTLAFAPKLAGSGQIFLHDVRPRAIMEAKKRLKRAGIQNAQTLLATDTNRLKALKKRMDWVLVDAPCSGTGTLRRNPDMKWKFSEELLSRLVSEQRVIFEQALSYVRPQGTIVYATCSILQEENENQMQHFLKTYPIEQVGEPFQSVPETGKKDGFFAVQFRKKV